MTHPRSEISQKGKIRGCPKIAWQQSVDFHPELPRISSVGDLTPIYNERSRLETQRSQTRNWVDPKEIYGQLAVRTDK